MLKKIPVQWFDVISVYTGSFCYAKSDSIHKDLRLNEFTFEHEEEICLLTSEFKAMTQSPMKQVPVLKSLIPPQW